MSPVQVPLVANFFLPPSDVKFSSKGSTSLALHFYDSRGKTELVFLSCAAFCAFCSALHMHCREVFFWWLRLTNLDLGVEATTPDFADISRAALFPQSVANMAVQTV
jgi:hypothetical protein